MGGGLCVELPRDRPPGCLQCPWCLDADAPPHSGRSCPPPNVGTRWNSRAARRAKPPAAPRRHRERPVDDVRHERDAVDELVRRDEQRRADRSRVRIASLHLWSTRVSSRLLATGLLAMPAPCGWLCCGGAAPAAGHG